MIPIKENLEIEGKGLLPHQFYDKKNINGLLGAYLYQLNNLNNDLFELLENFEVDKAQGVYLDYIGNIVGEKRNKEEDPEYRERIKRRTLINNSDGTPNTLLSILESITGSGNVRLWEHYPLFTMYYTDGNSTTLQTLNTLKEASPMTSEIGLIIDTTRRGWVGAEFYNQEANLIDDSSNNIVDEFNNSLILVSEGGFNSATPPRGKSSKLAEILDQEDLLVDDVGNNIVDQDDKRFIIFNTSGNVFSNEGIFCEIIQ